MLAATARVKHAHFGTFAPPRGWPSRVVAAGAGRNLSCRTSPGLTEAGALAGGKNQFVEGWANFHLVTYERQAYVEA